MSKSILQPDKKECYISGRTDNLHKHHIYGGNPLRKISEREGFWVWLSAEWHNMSGHGVHFDHELDLRLKRECQAKYEETYSRDQFMALIGRSFL